MINMQTDEKPIDPTISKANLLTIKEINEDLLDALAEHLGAIFYKKYPKTTLDFREEIKNYYQNNAKVPPSFITPSLCEEDYWEEEDWEPLKSYFNTAVENIQKISDRIQELEKEPAFILSETLFLQYINPLKTFLQDFLFYFKRHLALSSKTIQRTTAHLPNSATKGFLIEKVKEIQEKLNDFIAELNKQPTIEKNRECLKKYAFDLLSHPELYEIDSDENKDKAYQFLYNYLKELIDEALKQYKGNKEKIFKRASEILVILDFSPLYSEKSYQKKFFILAGALLQGNKTTDQADNQDLTKNLHDFFSNASKYHQFFKTYYKVYLTRQPYQILIAELCKKFVNLKGTSINITANTLHDYSFDILKDSENRKNDDPKLLNLAYYYLFVTLENKINNAHDKLRTNKEGNEIKAPILHNLLAKLTTDRISYKEKFEKLLVALITEHNNKRDRHNHQLSHKVDVFGLLAPERSYQETLYSEIIEKYPQATQSICQESYLCSERPIRTEASFIDELKGLVEKVESENIPTDFIFWKEFMTEAGKLKKLKKVIDQCSDELIQSKDNKLLPLKEFIYKYKFNQLLKEIYAAFDRHEKKYLQPAKNTVLRQMIDLLNRSEQTFQEKYNQLIEAISSQKKAGKSRPRSASIVLFSANTPEGLTTQDYETIMENCGIEVDPQVSHTQTLGNGGN